jgi:transcription elongation GreA/GreB family factor
VQQQLLVEEADDEERYVEVGDTVTYEFLDAPGALQSVRIVEGASNSAAGELNENAPLARALLDLMVGDENEISTPPHGVRKIRVAKVESPRGH